MCVCCVLRAISCSSPPCRPVPFTIRSIKTSRLTKPYTIVCYTGPDSLDSPPVCALGAVRTTTDPRVCMHCCEWRAEHTRADGHGCYWHALYGHAAGGVCCALCVCVTSCASIRAKHTLTLSTTYVLCASIHAAFHNTRTHRVPFSFCFSNSLTRLKRASPRGRGATWLACSPACLTRWVINCD